MTGLIFSDDIPQRRSLNLQFSSLMIADATTFPYNRLPSQTLRLSVLKLDDSSFEIEVPKTATVAELKQAVEMAFSHMPRGKISWPLVWGQFCLCYEGQKLDTTSDYLRDYGIKDGDQLCFLRHVSNGLQKKQLKKRVVSLKKQMRSSSSSSHVNRYHQKENGDNNGIGLDEIFTENGNTNTEENCLRRSRLSGFLGGLFSEARLEVVRRARMEGGVCHSMISRGIVSGVKKIRGVLSRSNRQHS